VLSLLLLMFASVGPVLGRFAGLLPANGSAALIPCLLAFTFLYYFAAAVHMISVLSILADIADEHELRTGARQEGLLYAARTFFSKLSSGLGHLVSGLAIDWIAFPTAAKPGEVAQGLVKELALLDGPLASIPVFFAIYCYRRYAIDRACHERIQGELRFARAAQHALTNANEAVDARMQRVEI
jgi:Na+/melibiose symporter-like transporter